MASVNPSTKLRVNTELNRSIKKAVIPVAGLGTRFLPLSKVLPKELFPLVDKPIIQYIIEEAATAGIKEIIFVIRPDRREVLNYFNKYLKRTPELEAILKIRKKNYLLQELRNLEKISKKISFSFVIQKEPLGDGHAILQAKRLIGKEPFAVLFGDDVVYSKTPCLLQLVKIFKKYQRPIVALYRLPKKKLPFYGIVVVKKTGQKLYQIKQIVEKPPVKKAPSNLAIVGKYILTPDIFNYLAKPFFAKASAGKGKEIILADALREMMMKKDSEIYGYEFEGKWLECGNKSAYLKSNLFLSLRHPQFGKELKKFLKN